MMTNILVVNPRPAQQEAMAALLRQSAPVIGVEFTIPTLQHLLQENMDGQHTVGDGKAAIEIALEHEIPAAVTTFAIVRADPDALGAVAVLELRTALHPDRLSMEIQKRIGYIAHHDRFQFGEWPGPQDTAILNQNDRVLFAALAAICMDYKVRIEDRVAKMRQWLETGDCNGLTDVIAEVKCNNMAALKDAEMVSWEDKIVALRAHTLGATQVAYCYAPVAIIANDRFRFPDVDGEHLKYTVCQFQAGKYVDLPAVAEDLNALETSGGSWGGSPSIIGSPQGTSSSLTMEQVCGIVRSHVK